MRQAVAELRRRFNGTRCDTDRHGNVRWYVLDPNGRKVRLRSPDPGSDAWVEEYKAARRGDHIAGLRPAPGTVAHLVWKYKASPAWAALRPSTQRSRGAILDDIAAKSGGRRAADITPKDIKAGRDARAATPAAANNRIKALSQLFAWGIENDLCHHNPARDVAKLKMRKGGFHSWTLDECLKFEARHPLGTKARTAYALALYLGARREDIPALGPQHRTRDGFMRVQRNKTKDASEAPQEIWICAPLAEALDAAEFSGLTYLATDYGRPFTVAGFGNKFRSWCDEAGLPQCSVHGLRKAVAARMREAGCSVFDIQSVTDHDTSAEVDRYSREAAKKSASRRALERTFGKQNVPPVGAHDRKVGGNAKKGE